MDSSSTIRVAIEKGKAGETQYFFKGPFKIGRDDECEVRLQDPKVSRFHAEVRFARGKWWLIDLKSTNGTYVEGQSINNIELTGSKSVEFGRGGPVLSFSVQQVETAGKKAQTVDLSLTELQKYYFEDRQDETVGAHTLMIRAVYGKLKKKQRRRFSLIIGALVCLFALSGGYAILKYIESSKQKALAEDIFYTIKSLDIEFADWLREARQSKDARVLDKVNKYQARRSELEEKYNEFLKGLDVYGKGRSAEERLILSIARTFGECEVAMPAPFVKEVLNYVGKWKSTQRFAKAVEMAKKNSYVGRIVEAMQANGMPPQFFYLAMVESNFDVRACGPPTRFGIAKGMWQFIPETAQTYGLRLGPRVDERQFDPEDERHDFVKSSRAAAEYIRYIYDTLAQASGLLVMASYNWGENRVIPLISTMPENPRERNFWRLLAQYRDKIPQETYDYVYYIVSASVIGENPRLFGFDFDNPLSQFQHSKSF